MFETYHTGTNWEGDAEFSQVARVPADADLIVTAGQVAYDEDGNIVGEGDREAQVRRCFENLERTLDAAGASMDDVLKLRYSVTDADVYDAVKAVRGEYISEPYPTGMLAIVDGLATPELLVEIEAIAATE